MPDEYLLENPQLYKPGMLGQTRAIKNAFDEGEFWGNTVYGPLGSGKSRYTIRVLGELRGETEVFTVDGEKVELVTAIDWNAWRDWMVFMPEAFLAKLDYAEQKGRQLPCLVWDDAGVWASNQRWAEEFSKQITQYVNVMRSDFANITLTTPNPLWLLKGFRTLPGGHTTRVNRKTGNQYQKHLRYARCYEGWMSPDFKKTGVKPIFDDEFSTIMPQRTSEEYGNTRRKYATEMKNRLQQTYYELKEEGKEKEAKRMKRDLKDVAGVALEDDDDKRDGMLANPT